MIDGQGERTRWWWTGVISDQSSFLLLPVSWQAPSQPLGCPVAMATTTVYHTKIWYWNTLEAQSIHFSSVFQVHFPHGFLQRFNMKHLFELGKKIVNTYSPSLRFRTSSWDWNGNSPSNGFHAFQTIRLFFQRERGRALPLVVFCSANLYTRSSISLQMPTRSETRWGDFKRGVTFCFYSTGNR